MLDLDMCEEVLDFDLERFEKFLYCYEILDWSYNFDILYKSCYCQEIWIFIKIVKTNFWKKHQTNKFIYHYSLNLEKGLI